MLSDGFESLKPSKEEPQPEPEKTEEVVSEPVVESEVADNVQTKEEVEPKEKIPYHQRPRFKALESKIADLEAKLAESAKAAQPTAVDPDAEYLVGKDPKAVDSLNKLITSKAKEIREAEHQQEIQEKTNEQKSLSQFRELQAEKTKEWEEKTGIKFTDGDKNADFKQIKKIIETANLLTESPNEFGHRIPDLDKAFAIYMATRQEATVPKVNPSREVAKKMAGSGVVSRSPKPNLLSRDQVRNMSLTQFLKSQR